MDVQFDINVSELLFFLLITNYKGFNMHIQSKLL